MTDRERLTKHWDNNCVATKLNYDFLLSLPNIEVKNFNAIIQKLAHYEDLEEQGKIIVLPCKPMPVMSDGNPFNSDVYCPFCGANLSGFYGDEPTSTIQCYGCGEFLDDTKSITREEAEKALAERRTKNESD